MVAGQVKIREVMFEYESKVQKTTLNLAADNFVKGFLVPNATKPERGKALLTPNFSNCQKR